ncbi:zinc finger protein 596-like [Mugil cephalus]|uniref:zinc finger protein 596-like n=1 Tax=Mugil cephalus TaxID=48193 RepID=UPI001FB6C834|nr:zinc finger protein 596-like [Mugil cephalus]XP_047423815.1 zinc finger protein 596-like [Mugil cephalus]
MSSGLLQPPGEGGEEQQQQQLCVLLLGKEQKQEEEVVRRKEVGCQWESPEEEERREVGCQSDSAETRDAGVQVDLLTQQIGWTHPASPAMLLQCFAVRADGPGGGALLQHCTTTTTTIQTRSRTGTRTRTKSVQASANASREQTKSRTQRRRQRSKQSSQHRPKLLPKTSNMEEDQEQEEEEEEEAVTVEEDTGDPTWTPPADAVKQDSDSQNAPVGGTELECTMCDVCGKVMKNRTSLARHSFIHTGKKPFSCHLCDMRFNRRDNLQHHLSRLHPLGVAKLEKRRRLQAWLCSVCGKTFNCRSRLKTHEMIHTGVKPHRCDLCPKAYMRSNDLEHHKKTVHAEGAHRPQPPSSLLCHFCGKEFKGRSQLAVHFQSHTGERPHLCDICGRKFSRPYQLRRHKILVHANRGGGSSSEDDAAAVDAPFSCTVCGKRLKSEALLAAHARIHTDDKPHRCGVCMRSFQTTSCLKQHHIRVHLKVKTGAGAGAAAAAAAAAATAEQQKAGATTAKTFPCSSCSKVFRYRSLLAAHTLIHNDARPFPCDFCSRRFRRVSHLKRHRRVVHDDGARPPQSFVCHICGKDKKCRSLLARHAIIHTSERPFACDLCTARFNRYSNLQQHQKRMHGIVTKLVGHNDTAAPQTYKQEEEVETIQQLDGT